jgi:hypothetical protein
MPPTVNMSEQPITDSNPPELPFRIPKFKPQVPEELMDMWHDMKPVERSIVSEQSIQKQQNDWIMERLAEGHGKMKYLEQKITSFDKLRTVLSSKWSLIASFASLLLFPAILLWLGALISKWLEHKGHP